jgi:transcriptional regulator with XRE-family HTH domain
MGRRGVSQANLAKTLGWAQARLSRRIAPNTKVLPLDVAELAEIAEVLQVPVIQLFPESVRSGA